MDLIVIFEIRNWVVILVAAIVSMLWSFIWYSNSLAGKKWMEALGVTEEQIETAYLTKILPVVLVMSLMSATVLTSLLHDVNGWLAGGTNGLILGLGLVASHVLILYSFALRPRILLIIDSVWVIGNFTLVGIVIGLLS